MDPQFNNLTTQQKEINLNQFPVVGTFLYPYTNLCDLCENIHPDILFQFCYQFYVPACNINYGNVKVKQRWVWTLGDKYECTSDIVAILIHSSTVIPKKMVKRYEGVIVTFQILNERIQRYVMKRKNGIRSRHSTKKKGLCAHVVGSTIIFDSKNTPENFLNIKTLLESQQKMDNTINLRKRYLTRANSDSLKESSTFLKDQGYKKKFATPNFSSKIIVSNKRKIKKEKDQIKRSGIGMYRDTIKKRGNENKIKKNFQFQDLSDQKIQNNILKTPKSRFEKTRLGGDLNKQLQDHDFYHISQNKKIDFHSLSNLLPNDLYKNLPKQMKELENLRKKKKKSNLHSNIAKKEFLTFSKHNSVVNEIYEKENLYSKNQQKNFLLKKNNLEQVNPKKKDFKIFRKKKNTIAQKIENFSKQNNQNYFSNSDLNSQFGYSIKQKTTGSYNFIDPDLHIEELLNSEQKKKREKRQFSDVSLLFSLSNDPW
ncbi:hypothetical protein M0813_21507 [Anaeramoeba flamelloides]|uniref:Uncharacterized protein n=1 Tax=Anaeramoeba flamelloides TaxID=1746091 RepID=A0ABQ8YI71_9EUKA|nr:hypothetical protein M0813_21507 [Anaeramoeba flamelloides]